MIYGQFAKKLDQNRNIFTVSESDSIIDFLLKEQESYQNLLLNESFIDDKERMIAEAKLEAINEVAVGVIIVALIAALTALAILLTKFSSLTSKGKEKVKEKLDDTIKKISEESKKKTEEQKSQSNTTNNKTANSTKKGETQTQKAADNRKEIMNEFYESISTDNDEAVKMLKDGIDPTKTGWFNRAKKFIEEDLQSVGSAKSFHGLNNFDYHLIIDEKCISRYTEMVNAAADPNSSLRDILKRDFNYNEGRDGKVSESHLLKSLLDSPYTFLKRTSITFAGDTIRDILVNHYNDGTDDSVEFVATNFKAYLDGKINEAADKTIKQLNKDIDKLKSTLKKLKDNDFNINTLKSSGTQGDQLMKFAANQEMYIENMLYVQKNAVGVFSKFVSSWAELEKFRFEYVHKYMDSFRTHMIPAIREENYIKFKTKYPEIFADIKDPFPEYK